MDYLLPSLSDTKQPSRLFQEKIQAGALGAKTGSGVYEWQEAERDETERRLLQHLIDLERMEKGHGAP